MQMKSRKWAALSLATLLAASLALWPVTAAQAQTTSQKKPDVGQWRKPWVDTAIKQTLVPTNQVIVHFQIPTDPFAFAKEHRASYVYTLKGDPSTVVFSTASVSGAKQLENALVFDTRVGWSGNNSYVYHDKCTFTPNDPYFHKNTPSAGYPGQWHLINEIVAGRDANVKPAWDADLTGLGVTLATVDDCLEKNHPDLSPNFDAADSWDFGQNDADPSPVYSSDMHGVSTSGVAAARGGNGVGVTGAAPYANLAGLRCDFVSGTVAMFVNATQYHSSGSNTNIKIKSHSYGYVQTYVVGTSEYNAFTNSANAGTIHCVAAGNERGNYTEDCNKSMLANNPAVITVAAVGSDGKFADYSSFGACVFVTAPSSTSTGYGITTTDRTGASGYGGFPDNNYTSAFGGTSSATPLVAGVMALVKQKQPNLDGRFARHLLTRCSDVVDAADASPTSDGGWKTNGAGLKFNQNYGFGKINAGRLVAESTLWSGVTPQTTATTGTINVAAAIPDNNPTGVTRTFVVTETTPLESVLVKLNITHTYSGDLEAYLTSPSGMTQRLMMKAFDGTANMNWTFVANGFWGENPAGTWTLKVVDAEAGDTGTWNSFEVTRQMGQLISASAGISTVSVSPKTVKGGTPSTGTVTLSSVASANTAVALTSSDTTAATVPATVTVLAGQTTASFTVTTVPVATNKSVTITGSLNSVTKQDTLTVQAPAISGHTVTPNTVTGGTATTGTVTLDGPAPTGGISVALSSGNTSAATVPATVTVSAGATTADYSVTTNAVATDTNVNLSATLNGTLNASLTVKAPVLNALSLNPTSVIGGSSSTGKITLNSPAPTGGITVPLASGNTAVATVPASVTVSAGATTAEFTVSTVGVLANTDVTISATLNGTSNATLTVQAPVLSALSLTPTSVTGGTSSTGTVTLNGPAPSGGISVALTSNNTAAASVPATVTVLAGATTADFTVTTYPVTPNATATIKATLGGSFQQDITVLAPVPLKVEFSPASVTGGLRSLCKVTLTGPAPTGGTNVGLLYGSPVTTGPASVNVAAGSSSISFYVKTAKTRRDVSALLQAKANGKAVIGTLTVKATVIDYAILKSLTVDPTSVNSGGTITLTIELDRPAPAGLLTVVTLSDDSTYVDTPSTVQVVVGQTKATVTLTAKTVLSSQLVTFTASYRGVTKTGTVTINP